MSYEGNFLAISKAGFLGRINYFHTTVKLLGPKNLQLASPLLQPLKGLFHPGCLARVVSLFASVAAIFMVHENGDEQRQAKR